MPDRPVPETFAKWAAGVPHPVSLESPKRGRRDRPKQKCLVYTLDTQVLLEPPIRSGCVAHSIIVRREPGAQVEAQSEARCASAGRSDKAEQ